MGALIDTYDRVVDVEYRGEKYSVRDNGAIMRYPKDASKPRKLDNIWTFGNTVDKYKNYFLLAGEPVHRIVASAFLDKPKDSSYVVDHIDTNRLNNRPENLRWVTRFENVFYNEITRKKIELICNCSAEEIMKDITILQRVKLPPNFEWMRVVSQEEANEYRKSWLDFVANVKRREDFEYDAKKYLLEKNTLIKVGIYPLEPKGLNSTVKDYLNCLSKGLVFYKRQYKTEFVQYTIIEFYYDEQKDLLTVATFYKSGIKSYYLTEITRKNDMFIYDTRSFFDPNGIEKYMTLAKGLEWTGGDVIDDFC